MRDFRELKVWQKAHELVLEIYKATRSFPREELYGLTSQLRRAACSVPANIAEGTGRDSKTELRQYMVIANGSLREVDYHVLLACELGYIRQEAGNMLKSRIVEVQKMLAAYIRKIDRDAKKI